VFTGFNHRYLDVNSKDFFGLVAHHGCAAPAPQAIDVRHPVSGLFYATLG